MGAFLAAMVAEAKMAREMWASRLQLETIYWGGGTPSFLSVGHLREFLPALLSALGHPKPVEWTVEMNPKTLTPEKLALLKSHGVTRASLGVQSWDASILLRLGRDHSPQQARESFQLLRDAEFPVVSLDLMFAIPGQSLDQWRDSLEQSIALQPDHISSYNLTYEEDTEYFERFQKGEYTRSEAVDEAFFLEAMHRLPAAGYQQYEISNYARRGFESRHNQGYWKGNDYLGLGPSAVSTIDRVRTKNVPDTAGYISALSAGKSATTEAEHLTEDQWRCERLALDLRTREGLERKWLPAPTSRLDSLEAEGLVLVDQDRIRLTQRGKLVADSVIGYLWQD